MGQEKTLCWQNLSLARREVLLEAPVEKKQISSCTEAEKAAKSRTIG
jgi:hypothetical protein